MPLTFAEQKYRGKGNWAVPPCLSSVGEVAPPPPPAETHKFVNRLHFRRLGCCSRGRAGGGRPGTEESPPEMWREMDLDFGGDTAEACRCCAQEAAGSPGHEGGGLVATETPRDDVPTSPSFAALASLLMGPKIMMLGLVISVPCAFALAVSYRSHAMQEKPNERLQSSTSIQIKS